MLRPFVAFEVRYRLRQTSTWVYLGVYFAVTLLLASVPHFGGGGGKVMTNSPYALARIYVLMTSIGTLILSALFGTTVLRDYQEHMDQIIFTKPIRQSDYLGGRLLGTILVACLVFSSMPLATLIGRYMPWADGAQFGPTMLTYHLQPWFFFVLPQILFCGAIFFAIGALTRNVVVVYLQGVVLFGVYLIMSSIVMSDRTNLRSFWPSVFDPIGLILYSTQTRYWTIAERNTQLFSLHGAFLYNRLLWLILAGVAVLLTFRLFRHSDHARNTKIRAASAASREDREPLSRPGETMILPVVTPRFGAGSGWHQFLALTALRVRFIRTEITFWAILVLMALIFVISARNVGDAGDYTTYPVTHLMVEIISGFEIFLLIITTIYAGELVWRDRALRFADIQDSLPGPNWAALLSHFASLAVVQGVLLCILVVSGVVMQSVLGYHRYDLPLYLKSVFLIDYVSLLQYILFALFIHTLLPNKFVGHGVVIGFNVLLGALYAYRLQDRLYLPFFGPDYTYSEMNGYGHFVAPLAWFGIYWSAFALVLAVITLLLLRRGSDMGWKQRLREARRRFSPGVAVGMSIFTALFLFAGATIMHNTHQLNRYRDDSSERHRQAAYETKYKQYADLPQPKIVDIDLNVDIQPERRSFVARGSYVLLNRTGGPVSELHLTDENESLREVAFDRPAQNAVSDDQLGYRIYRLDSPLAAGDSLRMRFVCGYKARGFRNAGERNEFAANGTFFDCSDFPKIGYQQEVEIRDAQRRRDLKLPPIPDPDLPAPDDPKARMTNLFTPDSDWCRFRATVSTSADQIALAPGYLEKEWTEGGRRFFRYSMGSQVIQNFYAFVSGRYEVRRDRWGDVAIEIYYQKGHESNVDRMIETVKKGLDYYTTNFGPYQFRQYRVIEYPRYRDYAQSFPNTVPFSESIGFIEKPGSDIDYISSVTAHELAHQWWGHQAIGCYAQGSNMLSESLAQYSTAMVFEKEYEPWKLRKYLRGELDVYLRGRGFQRRKEQPLAYAGTGDAYLLYAKGSMVMYALKDYLGEACVNRALRSWLESVRFQKPPYTNTPEFLDALRREAPPDMQSVIHDLFEDIILFDNQVVAADYRKLASGKYAVKLKLQCRKLRSDGLGAEAPVPIDDLVDVGVFAGSEKEPKVLYLQKHRFTQEATEVEVEVDECPLRAGVDPLVKLIDRNPSDNITEVTAREGKALAGL